MQLTQNLKGFARGASGVLGPVPMQASVAAALALLDHRIRRQGIRVSVDLPEAEIRVWAEQVRLEQVLINLLQNGLDALKDAADPEIRLRTPMMSAACSGAMSATGSKIMSAGHSD